MRILLAPQLFNGLVVDLDATTQPLHHLHQRQQHFAHRFRKRLLRLVRETRTRTLGQSPTHTLHQPSRGVDEVLSHCHHCIACPHRHQILPYFYAPVMDREQRLRIQPPTRASLCASIRSFLRFRFFGPSICRGFATRTSCPQLATTSRAHAECVPTSMTTRAPAIDCKNSAKPSCVVCSSPSVSFSPSKPKMQKLLRLSPRSTPTVSRSRLGPGTLSGRPPTGSAFSARGSSFWLNFATSSAITSLASRWTGPRAFLALPARSVFV